MRSDDALPVHQFKDAHEAPAAQESQSWSGPEGAIPVALAGRLYSGASASPRPAVAHGSAVPMVRRLSGRAAEAAKALEGHVAARAKGQQLIASARGGAGEGMAEQLVREGRSDAFGGQGSAEGVSAALRRLAEVTRHDSMAKGNVSVLASAADGGLSDGDKWNVIKVNTDMMSFISPGMTINKIVPDDSVRSILKTGALSQWGNSVKGSVAHRSNYEQGLTGEQAVSNFGLDYGGYKDVDGEGNSVALTEWGLSSYVKDTGAGAAGDPKDGKGPGKPGKGGGKAGKQQLSSVQNVFYVQLKLPDETVKQVRVPIHESIVAYAESLRQDLSAALAPGAEAGLGERAEAFGAKDAAEVRTLLAERLATVTRFLAVATSTAVQVSRNLAGQKNLDDPFTALGITRPGARLVSQFGTVNQEYFLSTPTELPEGSGLWLKDSTGVDKQVASFQQAEGGTLAWGAFQAEAIQGALQANEEWRRQT